MTQTHRWRSDLLPCCCFYRDLNADMIVGYQVESGVLWAMYVTCPVHGVQAMQPVPGVGMLEQTKAAPEQGATHEGLS